MNIETKFRTLRRRFGSSLATRMMVDWYKGRKRIIPCLNCGSPMEAQALSKDGCPECLGPSDPNCSLCQQRLGMGYRIHLNGSTTCALCADSGNPE